MLIPTLESRTRSMVREELASFEKVMGARLQAADDRLESRFETLEAKIDSLEERFTVAQDLAEKNKA
jgi:hypothetical protein